MHKRPERTSVLARERRAFGLFAPLLVVTVGSAWVTHLWLPDGSVWAQWNYLGHTLAGIVLAAVLGWYLVAHLRRVWLQRRWPMALSGLLAAAGLWGLVAGGLWIAIAGQTEAQRWNHTTHVVLGYAVFVVLALHLWLHRKAASRGLTEFHTLDRIRARSALAVIFGYVVLVVLLGWWYLQLPTPYRDQAAVADYDYSYGAGPFLPAQARLREGQFMDPRRLANSLSCSGCHREIFLQWQSSAHSQAALDPTYVTNVNLLERNRGIAATRYCEGCHAPVALLSGELSTGGQHGGVSGTPANHEGVGCMSCHAIRRAVHLNGVASYEIDPRQGTLFAGHPSPLAQRLHDYLIRIHPAQHRREMAPEISGRAEMCATCHEQYMDSSMNHWGWVKMQTEYSAWLRGPFSGRGDGRFSHRQRTACKDCHMPLVPGKDPSSDSQGRLVDHRAVGANTVLPLLDGDREQLNRVARFLRADKVRISIDRPYRTDAARTTLFMDEGLRNPLDAPFFYYLGETAVLRLSVHNVAVGHRFPGGTTDINEVWVYVVVRDAEHRLVYESGALDEDGRVDPRAMFYRTVPVDRQGKKVWQHDLFRVVGDAEKNLLAAGTGDALAYRLRIPFWAKSPLQVSAMVKYRKLNPDYARWALGNKYESLPIIDMAQDFLSIPLLERRAVVAEKPVAVTTSVSAH